MFKNWSNKEFDSTLLLGGLIFGFILFLGFIGMMILRNLEVPPIVTDAFNLFENLLLMAYTFHFTKTLPKGTGGTGTTEEGKQ